MIFRALILTLLLYLPVIVQAQSTYEVGVLGGFSNYQGDLVESYLEFGETNLAWGLFVRYNFDEKFAARVNFNNGQISGDDQNGTEEWRKERNLSFRSTIYEFSLIGEWNLFGQAAYSSSGIFESSLTPYFLLGVGLVKFNVAAEGDGLAEEEEFPNVFVSVPIGGGLKYHFQERVTLGAELAFRPAFGDYLDGVSQKGNPNKNDWYLFGGLTISIGFGDGGAY